MSKIQTPAVRAASVLSAVALSTTLTVCVSHAAETDAPAASAVSAPARTAKPNVLMITTDDMAVDDLKYMPNVRKLLVKRGTTLTSGLAPTPLCVPARASLLTGQYTHNHGALGVEGKRGGVRSFRDGRTLPTWLRSAGYETFFVGKYMNGYGSNGTERYVPPGWTGWYGSVKATYDFSRTVLNHNGTVKANKKYSTDGFGAVVDDVLAKPRRTKKPWYMWVNYVAPHVGGPRDADDPRARKGKKLMKTTSPAPRHRNKFRKKALPNKPNMFHLDRRKKWQGTQSKRDAQYRRNMREAYQQRLESLLAVDEAVAAHVKVLRRTGQLANTVIIFSSDNGHMNGEHNMAGKLAHYEESLKVPIVIRGPGVPKSRNATPVTTVDLPVTIAALAGAKPKRKVDGVDVMPVIRSRKEVERVIPIAAWPVRANSKRRIYSGVRYANQFTYVKLRRGREELYDLKKDPYQLRNVAKVKSYAGTLTQMRALNKRYRDCAGAKCPRGDLI